MVFRSGNAILVALLAALVLSPGASAWAWPVDGPVLRPFVSDGDPYAGGQHRGIDIGAPTGSDVRSAATWSRRVRRATAATGPLPDGPNRGRLVGHARPPGLDRGARRDSGQRGRRRRHDRPERRARGDGAVRLSRHPPHRGPERLRRPADASASQAGAGAGATGRSSRHRCSRTGSAGRGAGGRSVTLRPAARGMRSRRNARVAQRSAVTPRARDAACAGEPDADAAVPPGAGSACSARAVPSASRSCAGLARSTFRGARRSASAGAAGALALTWTRTAPRRHVRRRSWKRGRVARGGCC